MAVLGRRRAGERQRGGSGSLRFKVVSVVADQAARLPLASARSPPVLLQSFVALLLCYVLGFSGGVFTSRHHDQFTARHLTAPECLRGFEGLCVQS